MWTQEKMESLHTQLFKMALKVTGCFDECETLSTWTWINWLKKVKWMMLKIQLTKMMLVECDLLRLFFYFIGKRDWKHTVNQVKTDFTWRTFKSFSLRRERGERRRRRGTDGGWSKREKKKSDAEWSSPILGSLSSRRSHRQTWWFNVPLILLPLIQSSPFSVPFVHSAAYFPSFFFHLSFS